MYKFLSFLFILTIQNFYKSQESLNFQTEFFPNKVYEISSIVKSNSKLEFQGTSEILETIKNEGISNPMIFSATTEVLSKIKTGETVENNIPFELNFSKISTSKNLDGKTTVTSNPLEGSTVYGFYEGGKHTKIDSIGSSKIDENTKNLIKCMVEATTKSTNFPSKSLLKGDTFEQEIPMKMPIEGVGIINIIINTHYKLQEIRNNFAFFDTNIDFVVKSEIPDILIKTSGNGAGKVEFDIKNKISTHNSSKYLLKMNLKKDDLNMVMTLDSETDYTLKIK